MANAASVSTELPGPLEASPPWLLIGRHKQDSARGRITVKIRSLPADCVSGQFFEDSSTGLGNVVWKILPFLKNARGFLTISYPELNQPNDLETKIKHMEKITGSVVVIFVVMPRKYIT